MRLRKFVSFIRIFFAVALLGTGLLAGLTYGWLVVQYKKIEVGISAFDILADHGDLKVGLTLSGHNPMPFAVSVKKYEGHVNYGALSRKLSVDFEPDILIEPGTFRITHRSANVKPGYPAGAEATLLGMLRGKKLQVVGEATVDAGSITRQIPVSLNISIGEE